MGFLSKIGKKIAQLILEFFGDKDEPTKNSESNNQNTQ